MLPQIPKQPQKDVIYYDIIDNKYFYGLNPLECADPTDERAVQYALNQVKHIFEKVYGINRNTPLMYHYLSNCIYTLIVNPGCTIVDIRPLLTDELYREKLLKNVKNANVLDFWEEYNQMGKLDPRKQREERRTILNKLDDFSSFPLRYIVGQSETTLNPQEIMDQGKILLVR